VHTAIGFANVLTNRDVTLSVRDMMGYLEGASEISNVRAIGVQREAHCKSNMLIGAERRLRQLTEACKKCQEELELTDVDSRLPGMVQLGASPRRRQSPTQGPINHNYPCSKSYSQRTESVNLVTANICRHIYYIIH
jgi:hypothetical protein